MQLCFRKEEDLKGHSLSIHKKGKVMTDQGFKCGVCELTCKTKLKLKNHICKVEVKNPSCDTLHMNGWYDCHGCTQVYNSQKDCLASFQPLCPGRMCSF